MTLRPYQEKLIADLDTAWDSGARNVAVVLPTGGGKTVIKSNVIARKQRPACAIAHRQELVSQMSVAAARAGVCHRIIAPRNVIGLCVALHMEEFGRSFYHPNSPVAVAGVDTLVRRTDELVQFFNQIEYWDIDECFPAGTSITMSDGSACDIDRIRVGDLVLSFDEQTGDFCTRRVLSVMKNPTPFDMITVSIAGVNIRCTTKHPFLTKRGWVNANELKVNDEVMYGMRSASCSQREDMRQGVSVRDIITDDDEYELEVLFGANETKQSDVSRRPVTENDGYDQKDRTQTRNQRRKREDCACRGETCGTSDPVGFCGTTCSTHKNGTGVGLSDLLQVGYGASDTDDRRRGGRDVTSNTPRERTRCEERFVPTWSRVEGISVSKRTDSDGPFVYNFEVEGTHTYVVNGVVVHNCHHVLRTNKWGKAVELFPRALGVGYTATPVRADRKGLSRASSGVFDTMVIGPTMRELINAGYLSEYRIFAPKASIQREEIKVSASTGEFDAKDLREKTHASGIVGDVVSSYLRFAPNKLGLTFTVDVEEAERTAAAYRAAGVSAEIVTANTPDHIRVELLKKFRRRQIMQIVNVDILGEGFDVPGVEVVSGARATESFGLYMQQFGRVLRIMEGKTHGIYIDHVDNVRRHGLPDRLRVWTLDPPDAGSRRNKSANDDIPIRTCIECFSPYEAIHKCCPYCGAYPKPARRDAPEYVDGDLAEYSPELLARMRGEIIRLDNGGPAIPHGATLPIERRLHNLWHDRQTAQQELRETMQQWAGIWKYAHDYSDSMIDRRFYHTFGIDKLTAMTLNRADAVRLTQMIRETMT